MKSKMGMKSKMATKKRGKVANGGKMKKKKMGPKGYARGGVTMSKGSARGGVVNPSYSEEMPKAGPN
tara:strand:+ start:71 stop:271 length:201 start_codon:yes stop_codon:yes gene_type:complete